MMPHRDALNRTLLGISDDWNHGYMSNEDLKVDLTNLETTVNNLRQLMPVPDNYAPEAAWIERLKGKNTWMDIGVQTRAVNQVISTLATLIKKIFQ